VSMSGADGPNSEASQSASSQTSLARQGVSTWGASTPSSARLCTRTQPTLPPM
jgi:hypothetical protein